MRRRHVLALVILALVVATVLAMGPVRVWDAVTLRTVESRWPNGQLMYRYEVRVWESVDRHSDSGTAKSDMWRDDFDSWHENGQKEIERRTGEEREWSPTGQLLMYLRPGNGFETTRSITRGELNPETILTQERSVNGVVVETRTSPPWFTEEEILQAVEGVEE